MNATDKIDLRRHLVDLGLFFHDAKQFLATLQEADFQWLGYDCSVQVAIRLMRWYRAIDLTPRQTHVMERCVSEAIRRGAKLVKQRLYTCGWSMASSSDLADLAYSTASKALEHLTETHDFCGGRQGTIVPNPSIVAFVESNTRFVSRESLENFIYHKRFKAEPKAESSACSGFLLETYIRQQKSLMKKKQGKERESMENKIAELTARLYGLRSEISIDALDSSDDDDHNVRIPSHDQLALAEWGTYDMDDGDDEMEIPSHHLEFLDYLFQVGNQKMSARDLIPTLIKAGEYRAVAGLLRVLRNPNQANEADTLKSLLGNRTLADIRKQILRLKKTDSGEVVQLFDTCKSFLRWDADEEALMERVAACGVA